MEAVPFRFYGNSKQEVQTRSDVEDTFRGVLLRGRPRHIDTSTVQYAHAHILGCEHFLGGVSIRLLKIRACGGFLWISDDGKGESCSGTAAGEQSHFVFASKYAIKKADPRCRTQL